MADLELALLFQALAKSARSTVDWSDALPEMVIGKIHSFIGMNQPYLVQVPFAESAQELESDAEIIPEFVYEQLDERTVGERLHVMWDLLVSRRPPCGYLLGKLFAGFREITLRGAAFAGQKATVKKLLGLGVDPNTYVDRFVSYLDYEAKQRKLQGSQRESVDMALHGAAIRGDADLITMLLKAGADANTRGTNGLTPINLWQQSGLWQAVHERNRVVAERMVEIIGPNAFGPDGTTVLQEATKSSGPGFLGKEMVMWLLDARADINQRRSDGFGPTALHLAIEKEDSCLVGLLLARYADPNLDPHVNKCCVLPNRMHYCRPLVMAVRRAEEDWDGEEITRALLDCYADPNFHDKYCGSPLECAIPLDNYHIIATLLYAKADANLMGHCDGSPLTKAVELRMHGIVHLLLEYGANPFLSGCIRRMLLEPPLFSTVGSTVGKRLSEACSKPCYSEISDMLRASELAWLWRFLAKRLLGIAEDEGDYDSEYDYQLESQYTSSESDEDNNVIGENHVIEKVVEHFEEPAIIHEDEARAISEAQWSTGVQRLLSNSPEMLPLAPQRKITVLALTKHSCDIEEKLLLSEPAQRCMRLGIDVQPPWARGAKVFVDAFNSAQAEECRLTFGQRVGLGPNHVIVEESEESVVLSALRLENGRRALATTKSGGKLTVPGCGDSQWFMCSECSPSTWWSNDSNSSAMQSNSSLSCSHMGSLHVVIKNTFIQCERCPSETSGGTPRSAATV